MASVFSHGFAAFCFSKIGFRSKLDNNIIIAGIGLSILPDIDTVGFLFGVPYESFLGHRGFTHSIFFAIIVSLGVAILFRSDTRFIDDLFIYFFLCTVSHSLLDAMTTGGMGIALFSPFEQTRYFFNFRPILVSPIGISNFFSSWGLAVLISEAKFIGIIGILVIASGSIIKKLRDKYA